MDSQGRWARTPSFQDAGSAEDLLHLERHAFGDLTYSEYKVLVDEVGTLKRKLREAEASLLAAQDERASTAGGSRVMRAMSDAVGLKASSVSSAVGKAFSR